MVYDVSMRQACVDDEGDADRQARAALETIEEEVQRANTTDVDPHALTAGRPPRWDDRGPWLSGSAEAIAQELRRGSYMLQAMVRSR